MSIRRPITLFILAWVLLLVLPITSPVSVTRADDTPSIITKSQSNLRSGPGTTFSVLTKIPAKTTVPAVGRTADSTWVQVNFNSTVGWLLVKLVSVNGDLNVLPVIEAPAPPPPPTKVSAPVRVRAGSEFLTTAGGILRVSKVTTATIWPEHCQFNCTVPTAGNTLIIVWLAPKGRLSYDEAYKQVQQEWNQARISSADGFVGGPRILSYTYGLINGVSQTRLQLVFGAPEALRKFQFTWPGNAPISLRR